MRHFETVTELIEAITTIAVGQQVTINATDLPIAKNARISFSYFSPEHISITDAPPVIEIQGHVAVFLNAGYKKNEEKIYFVRCQ